MKIEFALCGDGTNIEVLLLENLSGSEVVADRIYTADHRGGIWYGDRDGGGLGVPVSARQLFEWVEDSWALPVIGGRYGYIHPYWSERAEARKRREARHDLPI